MIRRIVAWLEYRSYLKALEQADRQENAYLAARGK